MALLTYSSDIFRPGCHINYSSLHSPPPSLRPCPTAPSSPHKCFWKLQFFILMASVTAWYCAVRDARHSHRLEKYRARHSHRLEKYRARHSHRLEKYSFCTVLVLGWRGGAEKAEKQEGADRSGQEITLQQLHQGGVLNSFCPDQKSFYISFCSGQLILPWSVQVILPQWSTQLILPWSTHFTTYSTLVRSFYNSFYHGQIFLQLILPW